MRKLSVEVYHDIEFPEIDPSPHLEAIDSIAPLASHIQLAPTVRRLRVPLERDEPFADKAVRVPSDADIAVVLTDRTISAEYDRTVVGKCFNSDNALRHTVLVSGANHSYAPSTTQHELAHTFGLVLRRHNTAQHDAVHCDDPTCVMFEKVQVTHTPQQRTQFGARVLEKCGLIARLPDTLKVNDAFCDQCAEDLDALATIKREVITTGDYLIRASRLPFRD